MSTDTMQIMKQETSCGRPRKYATLEEARLANIENAKKRQKEKKDELKEKRRIYNQRYYQKRKTELQQLYDAIPIYNGYNTQ